ncbi:uncharacterized protein BX664DRAFT_318152 [Halteromyces radiatus]|uniref:uncharacterized protein n=1 Tax=Halteromyces radiatus TaxID=101107 RepID=UPI00221E93B8|nr:uncharacterized protein BX664DRAFT_318152 [Halteromyces radiatus]KAI8078810.1 hypothetical protein BX664DRAFT_318152 [Halteromyces radiatus]
MYLNRFLLLPIFFTVLFYECLFVEARVNVDCLATLGLHSAYKLANCKDKSCVDEVLQNLEKACVVRSYVSCYQLSSLTGFSTCSSKVEAYFATVQECESSPQPSYSYIRRKCIVGGGDDCHKAITASNNVHDHNHHKDKDCDFHFK